MGCSASSQEEKEPDKWERSFYETSCECWPFGKDQIKQLQICLEEWNSEFARHIILSYLKHSKQLADRYAQWPHPNYTTYIRKYGTPLDEWQREYKRTEQTGQIPEYNVVVLGRRGVGKSSLIKAFVFGSYDENEKFNSNIDDTYRRRIALNVPKNDYDARKANGTEHAILNIQETESYHEVRGLGDGWSGEPSVFLLVFSVDSQKSLDEAMLIRDQLVRSCEEEGHPIIAVCNKCDLRQTEVSQDKHVHMEDVRLWVHYADITLIETSAKANKNVNFLFRQSVYEFLNSRIVYEFY